MPVRRIDAMPQLVFPTNTSTRVAGGDESTCLETMKLYHATNEVGRRGIEEHGFTESRAPDSKGCAWFCSNKDETTSGGVDREWHVVVELRDDVAVNFQYRFKDGEPYPGNFLIPLDVVNSYRPFVYERIDIQ
jgi:hypothetical protein